MINRMKSLAVVTAAAIAASAAVSGAGAQERVQAGTLNCDISPGIGLIVGSQKQMTCQFIPSVPDSKREVYFGTITKFGLDVGVTGGGSMVWAVYAPTDTRIAALTGDYVGAGAEASAGLGLGANVLVGGSNRTIALQPLALQGQTGVNLAAGVTELRLRPAR